MVVGQDENEGCKRKSDAEVRDHEQADGGPKIKRACISSSSSNSTTATSSSAAPIPMPVELDAGLGGGGGGGGGGSGPALPKAQVAAPVPLLPADVPLAFARVVDGRTCGGHPSSSSASSASSSSSTAEVGVATASMMAQASNASGGGRAGNPSLPSNCPPSQPLIRQRIIALEKQFAEDRSPKSWIARVQHLEHQMGIKRMPPEPVPSIPDRVTSLEETAKEYGLMLE